MASSRSPYLHHTTYTPYQPTYPIDPTLVQSPEHQNLNLMSQLSLNLPQKTSNPAPMHLNNPEVVSFARALPTYLWNTIVNTIMAFIICEYFNGLTFAPLYYFPRTAGFLLLYYTITIILRFRDSDAHVFYEQIWACNFVMLLSALGMLLGLPMLTALSCVVVAVDQMCWYIEIIVLLFSGFRVYPIGVAKYLSYPKTSFAKKLTAWHHLWFLPMMLSTLGWELPPNAFLIGSCIASTMTITSRLSTPFHCLSHSKKQLVTYIREGGSQDKNYQVRNDVGQHILLYLNVNCPYAFWEDIPIPIFHLFNHSQAFLYLPYLWLLANIFLNLPAVIFLEYIIAYIKDF